MDLLRCGYVRYIVRKNILAQFIVVTDQWLAAYHLLDAGCKKNKQKISVTGMKSRRSRSFSLTFLLLGVREKDLRGLFLVSNAIHQSPFAYSRSSPYSKLFHMDDKSYWK